MKVFVDTNILLYTLDQKDLTKAKSATAIVHELAIKESLVVSLQVLNEMTNVLLNKRPDLSHEEISNTVLELAAFGDAPLSWDIVDVAWRVREMTGYRWWDSLLVATAQLMECRYFLSEDMQHERTVLDVTILNPFVTSPLYLPLQN